MTNIPYIKINPGENIGWSKKILVALKYWRVINFSHLKKSKGDLTASFFTAKTFKS